MCFKNVYSFVEIEPTQNSIAANDQRGNNSKNIPSRVMVLVHDPSSECALHVTIPPTVIKL